MPILYQEEIKSFKIVPVRIARSKKISKIVKNDEIIHYIYLKQHQSKTKDNENKERDSKSVFVINLPKDVTIKSLRQLFREISETSIVEEVSINNSLKNKNDIDLSSLTSEFFDAENAELSKGTNIKFPINTGLVTFVDKTSLKLFLNNVKKIAKTTEVSELPKYETTEHKYVDFIESYKANVPDISALKQEINVSIMDFNRREQEEMEELQESGAIIDEDGFQLVVGKHRKTKAAILGKSSKLKLVNNRELKEQLSKKDQKKMKKDFYRFQIRERKKKEMNDLLNKFKEDQARIKNLKDKKRFRPY